MGTELGAMAAPAAAHVLITPSDKVGGFQPSLSVFQHNIEDLDCKGSKRSALSGEYSCGQWMIHGSTRREAQTDDGRH